MSILLDNLSMFCQMLCYVNQVFFFLSKYNDKHKQTHMY